MIRTLYIHIYMHLSLAAFTASHCDADLLLLLWTFTLFYQLRGRAEEEIPSDFSEHLGTYWDWLTHLYSFNRFRARHWRPTGRICFVLQIRRNLGGSGIPRAVRGFFFVLFLNCLEPTS
jgi:hypothetical protein